MCKVVKLPKKKTIVENTNIHRLRRSFSLLVRPPVHLVDELQIIRAREQGRNIAARLKARPVQIVRSRLHQLRKVLG